MKTKPSLETASGIGHAAALLAIDPEIIRAAKLAGCPGFISGGRIRLAPLKDWIRRHRARPARKSTKAAGDPVRGMAASLRRLEQAEAESFGRLSAAVGSGAEAGARKAWLALAEALRRADLALEAARRDGGELVERVQVERALEGATAALTIGARQIVTRLSPYFASQENRTELFQVFESCMVNLSHAAAGMGTGLAELPPWACAAMHKGSARGLQPGPVDEWSKLGDLVRQWADSLTDDIIEGSGLGGEK